MTDGPHAIVLGPLPPPYGGVSIFMSSIKDAGIERGVEVWSYKGDGGDKRVTRVNHRTLGHIRKLMTAPQGARVLDSTHFHLEYPHPLLLPAWLNAKRLKKFTWIKICHDGSLPFRYGAMSYKRKGYIKRAVDAIDILNVSSPGLVKFFDEKFGREAAYISPLMPATGVTPEISETRFTGFPDLTLYKRVVSSIGAFIPSYGFHNVAAAVESLREKSGDSIGVVLIDGAFARDEAYKKSILDGRDWIVVLEGVPHPDVGPILGKSDVFVRAFAHESYGLSRVEAIWSGVPVIATNIGETRGMLTYEFDDVAALESNLQTVLNGGSTIDLPHWSAVFRNEADENLKAYIQLITGDPNA
ncbi:MAG TPA: glycosyltransferase family 4 protein [Pyrinomonadaceae bacterium]|jgi:glycosyltransferase involved in cell wall biosynthesis|nr:glycosyltransferase family 4 protein [Pyrinomonadaceae bacterium]